MDRFTFQCLENIPIIAKEDMVVGIGSNPHMCGKQGHLMIPLFKSCLGVYNVRLTYVSIIITFKPLKWHLFLLYN